MTCSNLNPIAEENLIYQVHLCAPGTVPGTYSHLLPIVFAAVVIVSCGIPRPLLLLGKHPHTELEQHPRAHSPEQHEVTILTCKRQTPVHRKGKVMVTLSKF